MPTLKTTQFSAKKRPPGAERAKIEACAAIRRIAMRNGWTQRDLARYLHVSQSTASKICRHRIQELTLNQLFYYLDYVCPRFEIMISI